MLAAIACFAQMPEVVRAAQQGDLETLKRLLAHGADLYARGPFGRTALHEAALNCHVEAARLLLRSGASPTVRDDLKRVPGMLALDCTDPNARLILYSEMLLPLTPPGRPWTLEYAISHRQPSVVAMLLRLHVDVDAAGMDGQRPLEMACLKGDAEITRMLLEHGADPRLPTKEGSTPLHEAALRGEAGIVELLLAHGAEVNAIDRESGATALYFAASFGRLEAVRALLAHGADREKANREGVTPLQSALKNGYVEVTEALRGH
jgi:ankyrin repeat protein